MFDCLHDMGDPRGCARHVRSLLAGDGTWMIVEPIAADEATGALESPVTRLFYNASTMICVPTSLAQEVGEALGAQAGEQRLSALRSEEHTSELQSLMRISYAVFCLKKKKTTHPSNSAQNAAAT